MDNNRREILEIEVHTNKSRTTVNLADDLDIKSTHINTAYMEQPGKFAYWSTVALQAKFACERKKQEVNRQEEYLKKTLYGELDNLIRKNMEMDGEKITESKVASNICTNEQYLTAQAKLYELQDELLILQERYQQLDAAREAMNQRKDMLISLGAQLRQENSNTD